MALTVTPRRTRLPADGKAQTLVTVKVTKTGTAQAGAVVDVATNLGAFVVGSETPTETSVTTAADGTAQVTYQAAATDGAARITATLRDNATVSETAIITLPVLGSITVGAIQNQVMGVKFSGWNEQNQLSVQLLDSEQKPYPDGLAVRFEHPQLGASAISTPYAPDTASCIKANGCLAFVSQTASPQDKPDTTGLAPLTMYSGTAAGPVAVNVTATAGGVTRNLQVQNIAIVGAKASGKNISLFCTPQTLPAFAANDCTNSFVNMTVGCTVFLADRFNNVLGVSTRADFRSEAGSPGPPVLTKAYDPVKGGDQTANLGKATNSVAVMGYRLPRDVPPVPGEFNAVADVGCGNATHNPRDGLSDGHGRGAGRRRLRGSQRQRRLRGRRAVHRRRRAVRERERQWRARQRRAVHRRQPERLVGRAERRVGRGHRGVGRGARGVFVARRRHLALLRHHRRPQPARPDAAGELPRRPNGDGDVRHLSAIRSTRCRTSPSPLGRKLAGHWPGG